MTKSPNRVRGAREARGLSQIGLAESARLTRQSLGAIEAGRATPAVDVALRIARALDCRVEDLFGAPDVEAALQVELAGSLAGSAAASRVALAHLRERWVALPLGADGLHTAADGLVVKSRGKRAWVAPVRSLSEARDNVVLMGCAAALGLLASRLQGRRGAGRFLWLASSSGAALRALSSGATHVAGVHWAEAAGDDGNVAAARRAAAHETLTLVTLARWEEGLLTRTADAGRIHGVADLGDRRVRLVAREPGAFARRLLERRLRAAGASTDVAREAPLVASGHWDVARAIAMGAADVGVATRDAALAFGLRFLPLAEERYDLVLPQALMADPRIERLLDALVSRGARQELHALGYDVTAAGQHVADVRAA